MGENVRVNFEAQPISPAVATQADSVFSVGRRDTDSMRAALEALEIEAQELRARLEIAAHSARHDALTGTLNRSGFIEEVKSRIARGLQIQNVVLIDLDRFKAVNDTLGHHVGDELIRKTSMAILAVLDGAGVLGRLDGDEFGLIIEARSDAAIDDLCLQILKICSQTRIIVGHEVQVSASIGVARQETACHETELMRRADLALRAAKREGRNRYRRYDAVIDEAARYRSKLESELERGLHSGQFNMVYQPIVTAQTQETLGYEALVRWDSPVLGQIAPSEFIPVAEDSGLILELGEWIARQSLRDCRRWDGPYVSINLSARQFLRHNIAERILQYTRDADVRPDRVQIELTETAIIDDVDRAAENLEIMRNSGVRVALDDFGTGYSSLVYLKQFAIDCIKIDKSFVDSIASDRQSAMIVASVAKLASSLGMSVVAEGVETEAQRTILIACGCGLLQGYLFGRPVGPREAGRSGAGAST